MRRKIFVKWSGRYGWVEDKGQSGTFSQGYIKKNRMSLKQIMMKYKNWEIEALTDKYLVIRERNDNPSKRRKWFH